MIELPLVGREHERLQLLDDVTGSNPGAVIIGPAGTGKSRHAREVLETMGRDGRPTRRIVGTPAGTQFPFGAFTERDLSDGSTLGAAAVAAVLTGSKRGAAPVILIDDAHNLDDASAHVVHQMLVNQLTTVILTVRSGEPISPTVASLISDRGLTVHELQPLTTADTTDLIGIALGGVVEARTSRLLIEWAGGSVHVLRELIEGSITAGVLKSSAGVWRLLHTPTPTPLLRELIDRRLRGLDPDQREAIELLALSAPLAFNWFCDLADPGVLEELERRGLVAISSLDASPDLSIRLANPLDAEAAREAMPITTRRRLSARLAAVAGPRDDLTDTETMHVMIWRLDSGHGDDPERLHTSAHAAMDTGDPAVAARLAAAAFDIGGDFKAALFASWCLAEAGNSVASNALLERALAICSDSRGRIAIGLRLAEDRWWSDHDEEAAQRILDDLVTHEGEAAHPFVTAQRSVFAVLNGDVAGTRPAEPLIEHANEWVASSAALATSLANVLDDHTEAGAAVSARAFERAHQPDAGSGLGDPGVHVATRAFNLACGGELEVAHALGELIHEVAVSQPGVQARSWAALTLAQVTLLQGRLHEAHRWGSLAVVLWTDSGYPGPPRWGAVLAALALTGLGDAPQLSATVARAGAYDARGFAMFDLRLRRAEAWSVHLAGDAGAEDALVAVCRDAHSRGVEIAAVEALSDLARLGFLEELVPLLDVVTPAGPLNITRVECAFAMSQHDPGAIETAATTLAGYGVKLEAAEAFASASIEFRMTDTDAASRCAHRSAILLLVCPGARTPRLQDTNAAPVLSTREREIAEWAATGATNRDIAEQLVVSERTVENHLYRAFGKLGVKTRTELAVLFGTSAPASGLAEEL